MNLADGVQLVSLIVLAVMMIGSALGVVLLSNIVYSAFLLGLVFTSMAGIYILLNAGFVAAAQVLIYVGAVNVLILFGIMLVNKREDFLPVKNAWIGKAATAAVCLGLFVLLGAMVLSTPWALSAAIPTGDDAMVVIGKHFFSDFLLPFELASVLLLMAMIGAIVLARRDFLPDELAEQNGRGSTALTLPERPRELVSSGVSSSKEN
ncbi:NADH-quinone oxidoreductase subunit J [Thermocoleostomius sinensis]|uniref:NADH-quinone oxidoreductase subunit J n=1 Tax=Thermocoleostomius sinensis A174 TaxID=2016057 RepID=A0A9E8Z8P1_9CYAN|nr:NADH-quinone oxidoreductase subunit J [Thermocoleostomius sinensis]WAL58356.1 NADH-quinone oxidoreductase subunit J [Thermocoleostomius sinensis A174]